MHINITYARTHTLIGSQFDREEMIVNVKSRLAAEHTYMNIYALMYIYV